MKGSVKELLGIFILTTSCGRVAGFIFGFSNVSSISSVNPMMPINRDSMALVKYLSAMLSTLEENTTPSHLHLLYDQQYTDTASSFIDSSRELDGITILEYNLAMTKLNQSMITSAVVTTTYFLVLCSWPHILNIFEMVRGQGLENQSVVWLVVLEKDEEADTVILDLEVLLREGTEVILIIKDLEGDINLQTSFVRSDGVIRFHVEDSFDPSKSKNKDGFHGLLMADSNSRYSNMRGRELTVTANDNWPFFGVGGASATSSSQSHSGIDVSIVETLSAFLNFTYRVVSPDDGKWGGPLPNGSVTGMIGMVARHEANLAICEITITGSRESVVDFTSPYYQESITLTSRAPEQKNRAFAVFSPFPFQVWLCIVISTLAMGPILTLQSKIMKTYQKKEEKNTSEEFFLLLQKYSFNMFRSLVTQNNLIRTDCWPHRFMFFFWYMFCIIVSALYSGTLTAVLAIPAYETPVDSLSDLPKAIRDGFTLGTVKDSSLEFLFKEAKEGIYRDVWGLFNHEDRAKSFLDFPEQGFDKIEEEKFVFICPRLATEIFARKRGRNKFHLARQSFYPQGYGIACPSGSPYKSKFDQLLARMVEGGLISKWATDEAQKVSMKTSSEEGRVRPPAAITLTHLQAAFFVLVLGYAVATFSIVMENIYSYLRPINQQNFRRKTNSSKWFFD